MSAYLFVYGTLRPGSQAPMARILEARARCLGPAKIAGRLYHLGAFPGLVEPSQPDEWALGDLYELSEPEKLLGDLDRYENGDSARPRLFERRMT
jgi:gamma-glutamylcyclotransferase (GGCT)/AIG2-like uncharacterized protein YtfP